MVVLLQRNSTHTWRWRFRMWRVRPSPYGAVNPAGSKTSCCEFYDVIYFLFISVSLSSWWLFMSRFCFGSILSCTRYGQCWISLKSKHINSDYLRARLSPVTEFLLRSARQENLVCSQLSLSWLSTLNVFKYVTFAVSTSSQMFFLGLIKK